MNRITNDVEQNVNLPAQARNFDGNGRTVHARDRNSFRNRGSRSVTAWAHSSFALRDNSSIAQYSGLSRESNALNLLVQSSLRCICGNTPFFTVRRGADRIEAAEHGAWKPPDMRKRPSGLCPLCRARL